MEPDPALRGGSVVPVGARGWPAPRAHGAAGNSMYQCHCLRLGARVHVIAATGKDSKLFSVSRILLSRVVSTGHLLARNSDAKKYPEAREMAEVSCLLPLTGRIKLRLRQRHKIRRVSFGGRGLFQFTILQLTRTFLRASSFPGEGVLGRVIPGSADVLCLPDQVLGEAWARGRCTAGPGWEGMRSARSVRPWLAEDTLRNFTFSFPVTKV